MRIIKLVIIAIAAALLIRSYIAEGIYPASGSMEPTLSKDSYYLLEKVSLRVKLVKRGDIVVFPSPVKKNRGLIKRVIAVPGDRIEIIKKAVFLNGVKLEENYAKHTRPDELLKGDDMGPLDVPSGKVFVMGDNRDESYDSRDWDDPVTKEKNIFCKY
jgi:signal peptidase I